MLSAWNDWHSSCEDECFKTVGGDEKSVEFTLVSNNESFVIRAPDAEMDSSWTFDCKSEAGLSQWAEETEEFMSEINEDIGGIPREADPTEVFELIRKKYNKAFNGIASDEDEDAAWDSDNYMDD